MIDARVKDLLNEVGLDASPEAEAAIVGRDPIDRYRFPVGEAAAVALAACGVAVSNLWELRGGRPQRARVEVRRAAASLHSRDFLRLNGGPGPASPATGNPLVDFYRCRDGRWIHLHGALPNLAYGTMRVLGCARERDSVAAAVARWDGEALEEALADARMCGALVRTADEWATHPQGRALADWPRVSITKIGESEPEPLPAGPRPLSGLQGARPDADPGRSQPRPHAGRAWRRGAVRRLALAAQPGRVRDGHQPRQAVGLPRSQRP